MVLKKPEVLTETGPTFIVVAVMFPMYIWVPFIRTPKSTKTDISIISILEYDSKIIVKRIKL